MEVEQKNNALKDLFNSANSILLLLPPDPGQDLLSAGISLHLSLQAINKPCQIGCSSEIPDFPEITGLTEIRSSVGNKNLQISFDFPESQLEKVDYEVSPEGKFSLLVRPKNGFPVPDIKGIKFSYSGANSDLVVVFGINSLEELGKIYAEEKHFLDHANILSINTVGVEAAFAGNMFHLANISFSELLCLMLQRIELIPTPEAACNLLNTIYKNTGNLTSPKMTAETFASIAFLMKNGAKIPNLSSEKPSFFEAPLDWKAPKVFHSSQPAPLPTDKL
jgi:nanoRNase/pAp phosphatase (c-di-AMP/oligoRNAs hydrolase)